MSCQFYTTDSPYLPYAQWMNIVLVNFPLHFSFYIFQIVASVVFMIKVIKQERRLLTVYPVLFFYTFIGWMILLQ